MTRLFRPYSLDQRLLLPPDLREWLPEDDLAWFISDAVDELDLGGILRSYENGDGRGQPPYHPAMMVKLLLYAYCVGRPSSRKIEQATHRDVAFRVLAGDQHPDHDSVAQFRRRHLEALAALFVQVLRLCQTAGLVTLGHVALDGTKVRANASKRKALTYARMEETERRLQDEVRRLLEEAERVDAAEDARYGLGRRGDELPAELARRETRLAKIRAAKAALEQQAREAAARGAEEGRRKLAARAARQGRAKGGVPTIPDPAQARPAPSEQRNFTDPDSRIMKETTTQSFVQAYNAQAAVDGAARVIVACGVTQDASDARQFGPMLTAIVANTGARPRIVTADAGYFSEANVQTAARAGLDVYLPPDKRADGRATPGAWDRRNSGAARTMRAKLDTPEGRAIYARRKSIVEGVFGQTKEVRGFRRFALRGYRQVLGEWAMICLTHNLLKLFRAPRCPCPAS
jgi:transposase